MHEKKAHGVLRFLLLPPQLLNIPGSSCVKTNIARHDNETPLSTTSMRDGHNDNLFSFTTSENIFPTRTEWKCIRGNCKFLCSALQCKSKKSG